AGAGPIVRAERRSRQSILVVKIAVWVIRPRIAHGGGGAHFFAGYDDFIPFYVSTGPVKLFVRARHREPLQRSALRFEPVPCVTKTNANLVFSSFHRIVKRSRINNFVAVCGTERPQRQPLANLRFSRRMRSEERRVGKECRCRWSE